MSLTPVESERRRELIVPAVSSGPVSIPQIREQTGMSLCSINGYLVKLIAAGRVEKIATFGRGGKYIYQAARPPAETGVRA